MSRSGNAPQISRAPTSGRLRAAGIRGCCSWSEHKPIRQRTFQSLALALAFELSLSPLSANPVGGTVTQGSASFNTQGSQLTIQTSDRAFINWQSFNIGAGETTTFVQPSSSSLVWNQINDPNPSQILGNLNANGYVVLQNQNGFFIGGQAAISAHRLVMTTSPIQAPNLTSGGPWQFNALPPAASIINYGQIKTSGPGGSIFLIAENVQNAVDTQNNYVGTISAPQGNVGLYAGKEVLVSTRPDGRGLSAKVTLPQGSVDNEGHIIADAGTIEMHAQVVNQGGLLQANSLSQANGIIELVASDSLTTSAGSSISAKGDASSANPSQGGFVVLKSDGTFTDTATSTIDVSGHALSGQAGGRSGVVEIFGNDASANPLTVATIQSQLDGTSAANFSAASSSAGAGWLLINPQDITLSLSASTPAASSPTINLNDSSSFSKIDLFASGNINLKSTWSIAQSQDPQAFLNLSAGNSVTLGPSPTSAANLVAGNNWEIRMSAGSYNITSKPASGSDGIYLNSSSVIQTQNGDIDLWAANEVIVNSGAIRTASGGSIGVSTLFGDVNSGKGTAGFLYSSIVSSSPPYYYSVSPSLGGISTEAGGDVTINAGGNVVSFFPNSSSGNLIALADPGTGAFGPQAGNVTITAGGSVFGHYVLANGVGSITAGKDAGSSGQNLALSLISGSWNVDAPNGNIYLQEVRNPNGVFDSVNALGSKTSHTFDYSPNASVSLTAGNGVYLTGQSLPRQTINNVPLALPVIYPSSLYISAGSGGVTLQSHVILFPSKNQNLEITTSSGGGFFGTSAGAEITMSDSSQTRWLDGSTFSDNDHGGIPLELNNPNPVVINISGDMENLGLVTTKQTWLTVGGNMIGCNFSGEKLHPTDVTSINVAGQIFNRDSFNYVFLNGQLPTLPAQDTSSKTINNWEGILSAAVDPNKIASEQVAANVSPSQYYNLYVAPALEFGSYLSSFFYNPKTGRLTFVGDMNQPVNSSTTTTLAQLLEQPLTVVRYGPDGNPVVANGHIVTDKVSWVDAASISTLATESQGAPALSAVTGGYLVGGPGQFDIHAGSISLGNTLGILSYGTGGAGSRWANLAPLLSTSGGASVNVQVDANLDMAGASIATLGGGTVTVNSLNGSLDLGSQDLVDVQTAIVAAHSLALGVFSSGGGDVTVTAHGDINVDSSRIATFNGGNINVESFYGNVNAGNGGTQAVPLYVYFNDPATGLPALPYVEQVYASGIVAETLVNSSQVPGGAATPGNISVYTPRGDIIASKGGILQEALNGNVSAGPTVTLQAGSDGFTGNIDLGDTGVIGGTVNATANGNISGLVISRQNSTINAAQSFSGTVLSGGTANLSAGGAISGTVIGIGGVNASGGGGVSATLLGQNVSVGGGAAQSTLGTSATATATSTSAAGQSTADAKDQIAQNTTQNDDDENKKKGKRPVLTRRVGRVTVILPHS